MLAVSEVSQVNVGAPERSTFILIEDSEKVSSHERARLRFVYAFCSHFRRHRGSVPDAPNRVADLGLF